MNNLDSCITWLDRLNRITRDYLEAHVDYIDSIEGWMWESYSQCIEISYSGYAWELKFLSVPLKDLLEWGDENVN